MARIETKEERVILPFGGFRTATTEELSMDKLDRRSALALFGLLAASAAGVKSAASQSMDTAGKDTTLASGVVLRVYGEGPAMIPGFTQQSVI